MDFNSFLQTKMDRSRSASSSNTPVIIVQSSTVLPTLIGQPDNTDTTPTNTNSNSNNISSINHHNLSNHHHQSVPSPPTSILSPTSISSPRTGHSLPSNQTYLSSHLTTTVVTSSWQSAPGVYKSSLLQQSRPSFTSLEKSVPVLTSTGDLQPSFTSRLDYFIPSQIPAISSFELLPRVASETHNASISNGTSDNNIEINDYSIPQSLQFVSPWNYSNQLSSNSVSEPLFNKGSRESFRNLRQSFHLTTYSLPLPTTASTAGSLPVVSSNEVSSIFSIGDAVETSITEPWFAPETRSSYSTESGGTVLLSTKDTGVSETRQFSEAALESNRYSTQSSTFDLSEDLPSSGDKDFISSPPFFDDLVPFTEGVHVLLPSRSHIFSISHAGEVHTAVSSDLYSVGVSNDWGTLFDASASLTSTPFPVESNVYYESQPIDPSDSQRIDVDIGSIFSDLHPPLHTSFGVSSNVIFGSRTVSSYTSITRFELEPTSAQFMSVPEKSKSDSYWKDSSPPLIFPKSGLSQNTVSKLIYASTVDVLDTITLTHALDSGEYFVKSSLTSSSRLEDLISPSITDFFTPTSFIEPSSTFIDVAVTEDYRKTSHEAVNTSLNILRQWNISSHSDHTQNMTMSSDHTDVFSGQVWVNYVTAATDDSTITAMSPTRIHSQTVELSPTKVQPISMIMFTSSQMKEDDDNMFVDTTMNVDTSTTYHQKGMSSPPSSSQSLQSSSSPPSSIQPISHHSSIPQPPPDDITPTQPAMLPIRPTPTSTSTLNTRSTDQSPDLGYTVMTHSTLTSSPSSLSSPSSSLISSSPSLLSTSSYISQSASLPPPPQTITSNIPVYPSVPSDFPPKSSLSSPILSTTPPPSSSLSSSPSSSLHTRDSTTSISLIPSVSSRSTLSPSPLTSSPSLRSPTITATTSSAMPVSSLPPGHTRSSTNTTASGKVTGDGFMDGNGPIIIGSACGALIVFIVVIIAVMCLIRRRKRRKKSSGMDRLGDDLWIDMSGRDQRYKLPSPSLMSFPSLEDETVAPDKNDNTQFYKVIHDYTALQDGHLNLSKGDKVQLLETADGGWCRGVSDKDGLSGWFPNSYVVQVQSPDKDENDGLNSRGSTPRSKIQPVYVSSFQIKKTENEYATPVVFDSVPSYASLERKRGANDVIASWVKMASSVSMSSIPSVDSAATGSALEEFNNPSMKDCHFRAIYAYKPVCRGEMGLKEGELVVCKEKDKNGWMLGFKPQSKEEGWFPAVYVDEVLAQGDPLGYTNVPSTYELLESNKLHSTSQPWTGIEHKSISEYSSDVPGDLSFQLDDAIVVYQTLANGWWFGATGDKSGWFPGAFVDMISVDEKDVPATGPTRDNDGSSRPSTPHHNEPSIGDVSIKLRQKHTEDGDASNTSAPTSALNSPRESIASSIYSENDKLPLMTHKPKGNNGHSKNIRPNRRAPAPPPVVALKAKLAQNHHVQDGVNSLRRPARPAPAPPTMKEIENSMKTPQPNNIHGKSSETLNDRPLENNNDNKPKKPVVLINGKKPKLVKTKPSIFDDKCLNPMIRPAKRGFAPTPDQYRIEKTKQKRISLSPNPVTSSRHSFTSDYSIPNPTTPLSFAKKHNYNSPDNHLHNNNNNLTRSSPTSSMDSGMDLRMQRPYTPTHPSPLTKSFNEYDRIAHHAERETSPSLLQRSNTSTPTAFHRLTPRNTKNISNNNSNNTTNNNSIISPPYPPSVMSCPSNNDYGYITGTPSIQMNNTPTDLSCDSSCITTHTTDHTNSVPCVELDSTLNQESTDDPDVQEQPTTPSVSSFLSPNRIHPQFKSNNSISPRRSPKPIPSPRVSPKPSPRSSPKPYPIDIPKPKIDSNETTGEYNANSTMINNHVENNNKNNPQEPDKFPPDSCVSDEDIQNAKNTFRPITADPPSPDTDLYGHKLLRYSDGAELDSYSTIKSDSTCDSISGGLSLSPNPRENSIGSPLYQESFREETTAL